MTAQPMSRPPLDVSARLELLEHSVSRLRALCAGLAVAATAVVSAAWWQGEPAVADIVRARGLVIVDGEGRERILIGAPVPAADHRDSALRGTGLVIVDDNGKDRLALGETTAHYVRGEVVDRERAFSLLIYDRKGDERGGMGTFDGGKAVVVLDRARPGSDGVALLVDEVSDFVGLAVNHRQRERRYVQAVALGAQRGGVFFNLDDPTGRRRLSLRLPADGDPACRIYDAVGDGSRDVFESR